MQVRTGISTQSYGNFGLDGQAVYPFAGWLGLAAALEHVIGAGTLTRPGPPAPADG